METLEKYFEQYRKNIVGIDSTYQSPYGRQKLIYADWIASGRLYSPIETKIKNAFGPFVANTHTESNETGTRMTYSYCHAHELIKKHVNAGPDDVIITAGTGMTGVINKFQRILGLKPQSESVKNKYIREKNRPVVFISHMEHHSNHTSWLETTAEVILLKPDKDLLINPAELRMQLKKYKDRPFKIGSFTACSNVTGIVTPYYQLARIMHEFGGLCFIDFAASAPYVKIDMHPENPMEKLDAIFFSPHKFLGGPGSSGVLIFDSAIYQSKAPDHPGGGTVDWTNPWGEYKFIDDIETREDGGTPGFLQAIRAALTIELKKRMGVENIKKREDQLVKMALERLNKIDGINILADNVKNRLGCISFYTNDIHYNLFVKLLSDRFGIQMRGGCVCAGTYGHFLLNVSYEQSKRITDKINLGNFSEKPGWVRLSLHPTMTDSELSFIMDAIEQITNFAEEWEEDYTYSPNTNEFYHNTFFDEREKILEDWFKLPRSTGTLFAE